MAPLNGAPAAHNKNRRYYKATRKGKCGDYKNGVVNGKTKIVSIGNKSISVVY
jgi:hypothetical protein